MNAQHGAPAREPQPQLRGETIQDTEQAGLVQHTTGPADVAGHRRVPFHQFDATDRVGDSLVRRGLLARQDVPVCVPAQHLNARQPLQQLKHLNGARPEQDMVPERPPAVHPETVRIR